MTQNPYLYKVDFDRSHTGSIGFTVWKHQIHQLLSFFCFS
ncbi:hypothetical protein Z949_2046 [Sulfitobacter guttiformis KCTC 32187]|nr:hypothetical protein Z949_2046 [Sulfitobacter guttiformis KCTC 32187]